MRQKYRKVYISTFISLVIHLNALVIYGQDPVFSQYYTSSLYLNPSLAGTEHNLTMTGIHRTQWFNLVPYNSNLFSFLYPIHRSGANEAHLGGLGATFVNQTAGDGSYSYNSGSISAAYNLPIPAYKMLNITFGLQIGFIQKQINAGNFQFGSQYNPVIGAYDPSISSNESIQNHSVLQPDVGAGFLYYHNAGRDYHSKGYSGYFGIAASHLNRPNESFTGTNAPLPVIWRLHGGLEFQISKNVNFSPNVLYVSQNTQTFSFGGVQQLNAGAYFTFHIQDVDKVTSIGRVLVGSWYRLKDSFIFTLGIGNKYFNLGLSYDLNTSYLNTYTNGAGAYELSLKIQKPTLNKMRKFHTPLM